jgi:cytochrome c-type biogenesis protein
VIGPVGVVGVTPGPLLYAFTLGLVAAVNPCGFPLLGAYLSFFVAEGPTDRSHRAVRGLRAGASVTSGFLVVFGVLGILAETGIEVVLSWVPWVMIPIGVAMTGIGLAAVAGHPLKVPVPARRLGAGRGVLAMAGFGVTYAVASLTCALPLFLAAVAGSFGRLGFGDGIGTFVAYALGMGLFLMVAGLVVANLGVSPLRRFAPLTRFVPRLAGIVLSLVGAYLTFYWSAYVADPTAQPEPIGLVEHVQTAISNWLSSSPRAIGVVLGLALLVGLALASGARRRNKTAAGASSVPPGHEEAAVGG